MTESGFIEATNIRYYATENLFVKALSVPSTLGSLIHPGRFGQYSYTLAPLT